MNCSGIQPLRIERRLDMWAVGLVLYVARVLGTFLRTASRPVLIGVACSRVVGGRRVLPQV